MAAARSRRTTILIASIAAVILIAAAVAVFLFAQRDAQPAAAPSSPVPTPTASPATTAPTSAPTSAPTPTPTESAPRASEVVMAATGFTIAGDDGSPMLEFRWRDEVGPAVTALTEAFGAEPNVGVYPGDGNHFPDYTTYDWSGFTLYDMIEVPGDKPRAEYSIPTWISIRSNDVSGVPVAPEFALAIGATADAVRSNGPDDEWSMSDDDTEVRFVFDIDRTDFSHPDGAVETLSYSVFADTKAGSGVTAILYRPYSGL